MKKARAKTKSGQFATKRFDTKMSTIEKTYNVDLGVRGDMKLGNYLKEKGYPSLSKMLKGA
jgi:hypothetical protein